MGIFIHMTISHSVTRDEWARFYQETLDLVKAFPLAEGRLIPIRGIKTACLVRTEEREVRSRGWRGREEVRWGWYADGDYIYCHMAEDYYLPRDLVRDELYEADAPDALFQTAPVDISGYAWDDPRFKHHYSLWGNKTQGEPYHMYLLSIGCLIAARLGQKAYLYGDITMGQCQKAVDMANEHLETPIELPDWCDVDRLFARVSHIPLAETERLRLFAGAYLGRRDAAFGAYLRDHFSREACDTYWDRKFQEFGLWTWGFRGALKEYLLWGFDLDRLCPLVRFEDGKTEDKDPYEHFVTMIMDSKLHLPDKDCADVLEIDADQDTPYGVATLLAHFFLRCAKNKKVDRHIPLEEIRSALRSGIGARCPVDELIDAYIEKEAASEAVHLTGKESIEELEKAAEVDPAKALNDVLNARMQKETKLEETYDVARTEYLPFYKTGDSMNPNVEKSARRYLEFCREVTDEDTYRSLMEKDPRERCLWLADRNRSVMLRDRDWEKIYDDVMAHPESFARYYPMGRVEVTSDALENIVRAFVTNDELWSHMVDLRRANPNDARHPR